MQPLNPRLWRALAVFSRLAFVAYIVAGGFLIAATLARPARAESEGRAPWVGDNIAGAVRDLTTLAQAGDPAARHCLQALNASANRFVWTH